MVVLAVCLLEVLMEGGSAMEGLRRGTREMVPTKDLLMRGMVPIKDMLMRGMVPTMDMQMRGLVDMDNQRAVIEW